MRSSQRFSRSVVSFLVVSAFCVPVWAATPSGGPLRTQQVAATVLSMHADVEGIHEYRLPNGLQVLLIPDDAKPTTTVNMTYRVGSRHESYGETGMAHLLEHMLFKGTPRHPQVWADFNKRGFSANGSTWYDRTNYFASFAANEENLRWYLAWQADAMVNSFIARKDLDSEMTVVRNEMEMGENSPDRILMDKTLAAMYQWHNYGKSTIGARADVEGVDISHLQAFYKRYYQPDNATLIVSGKFDESKVLAWVQRYFGVLPKPKRALPPLYTLDPVQDGERSVTLRRVGGVPLLYAGYHVMPGAHRDFAAVELLSIILGDAPSGRLHKQLTEKQLAASVFAFAPGLADPGFLLMGAQLGSGQDAEAAKKAMLDAAESIARQPITAEELDRAKAKWLNAWEQGFSDPQHVGVALSEAVALGDWRLFFLTRDRVKAIALSDVQRVAEHVLLASNRTTGEYVPTAAPVRADAPARVNVSEAMKDFQAQRAQSKVAAFDASPANIDASTERFKLSSGMQVALLSKPTRGEAVKGALTLHFGNVQSLTNWGSVPGMMAALLDKGTTTLSRQQVQDKLDGLQAEVAFSSGAGTLTAQFATRRAHVTAVLALLADMLQHPAFPADALEEVRRQALAGLDEQRKEPEAVLAEAMARHGNPYPKGDVRYAETFDESEADLKAVQLDRVRAYHQQFLGSEHGQLALVGDVDRAATQKVLEDRFGSWRSATAYERVPSPLVSIPPAQIQLITPDKQNATLSVVQPLALNDQDPDYPALMLANHLLGSGGDSRLWNRIREKEGLSYNVFSAVQWNPHEAHSVWSAGAIFAPQNKDRVLAAFKEEVQRALEKGFTQAEFEAGRRGLLNFRRLGRAQDARLAAGWVNNLFLDRTYALSAQVDAALEKLTVQQVNDALRRYLKPDQFVMGVAGDFKASK